MGQGIPRYPPQPVRISLYHQALTGRGRALLYTARRFKTLASPPAFHHPNSSGVQLVDFTCIRARHTGTRRRPGRHHPDGRHVRADVVPDDPAANETRQGALRFSRKKDGPFLSKPDETPVPPLIDLARLLNVTEKYLDEEETAPPVELSPDAPPSAGTSDKQAGGQGYPDVGKWESGATRGPGNQISVTKWSDVVGSSLTRGKANPLE